MCYRLVKSLDALGLKSRNLGETQHVELNYHPVDVFTSAPLAGNPLAVFPDVAVDSPVAVDPAHLGAEALNRVTKDRATPTSVFVFAPTKSGAYSRMFAPQLGFVEDAATGSTAGPLAFFMKKHGFVGSDDGSYFVSEQGAKMARRSLLQIKVHGKMAADGIEVGGNVAEVATAVIRLPPPSTVGA